MPSEHIDATLLSDLKEVMETEFNRLVTTYFDDVNLRLEALQQALVKHDLDELRKVAHSFKGSSSNMGAPRLADLLQRMEDMAKQGSLNNENVLLQQIRDEYQFVNTELKKWMLV